MNDDEFSEKIKQFNKRNGFNQRSYASRNKYREPIWGYDPQYGKEENKEEELLKGLNQMTDKDLRRIVLLIAEVIQSSKQSRESMEMEVARLKHQLDQMNQKNYQLTQEVNRLRMESQRGFADSVSFNFSSGGDSKKIYMDLIKKFHPDKAKTEEERKIYTEIAKEINSQRK